MARSQDKLDITPKVIDLGDTVIQLSHVASAGYGTTYPYRPLGLLSLAAGLGLIGHEVFTRGAAAFALKGGGAPPLWLAFGALGVGLFLTVFARRLLVIRTSDGRRTVVNSGDDKAAAAAVVEIREAMEAAGAPFLAAAPTQSLAPPMDAAHAPRSVPARIATPLAQPAARPQITAQPPAGEIRRTADAYANGAAGRPTNGAALREPLSAAEAAAIAQRRHLGQMQPAEGAAAFERHAGAGMPGSAMAAGAGMAGAPAGAAFHAPVPRERASLPQTIPTTPQPDPAPQQDLRALVEHVRAANVQHKEALLDLLRVVGDHYQGRASREDAVAHWRSFADYVQQYLGDVEGLLMLTERYGQHMVAGR